MNTTYTNTDLQQHTYLKQSIKVTDIYIYIYIYINACARDLHE